MAWCRKPPAISLHPAAGRHLQMALVIKVLDEKRAQAKARALKVVNLATRFPSLEHAMRSRNNEDFRLAVAQLARGAKSEEAAVKALSIITSENFSAFMQFASDVFQDIGPRHPQASASINTDDLFEDEAGEPPAPAEDDPASEDVSES